MHTHGHVSETGKHSRALWITFALTFLYFIIEVVFGFITNSLALLADAAHMLTDVGGIGLALFATWLSQKPPTPGKTYGYYRVEILAALTNAAVLFVMSFYILAEAYQRFQNPPEVQSVPMIVVAVIGLIINLVGVWNLRRGSKESLNVHGAFLEVVSDALGSVGVIIAGVIMMTTAWYYADPLFSGLIGLYILPRTWRLLKQAVDILLEGTPAHIDVESVKQMMLRIENVVEVHDLHVWTITSGLVALTAHVVLADKCDSPTSTRVLEQITTRLKEEYRIGHTTLQIEHINRSTREMHV